LAAKYEEVIKKLEAKWAGAPKGRSYHVSYGDPGKELHAPRIPRDSMKICGIRQETLTHHAIILD